MDIMPPLTTAADLELRAARVADPALDMKTKLTVASELREMIDTVKDPDSSRVLPHMIPVLLDILRSGEPSFHKDSVEFQFRRCLVEILHRIPSSDVIRPQALPLFHGMLFLLHNDNEENGITCCKTILDIVRSFRTLTEELLAEFMGLLQENFQNVRELVVETLSEDSVPMDPNVVLPAKRSFKVLAEMTLVIVSFLQSHRPMALPVVQSTLPLNFEILALQSPAQKKAREDYEAMGGFWAGMAPTIKNPQAYSDFISAQIKMVSYLAFVLRGFGEQLESEGEVLILSALRILQDCPAMAISARKDLMIVFRHLMGTSHRRALLPQIDKLFDERVLLGTGVSSREYIRSTAFGCFADLLHHLRGDLTPVQLTRICSVYLRHLHNPYLTNSIHILSAKMIFNLIEVIITKDTRPGAAKTLSTLFDASVDKIESMTIVLTSVTEKMDKSKKQESEPIDATFIEKSRPVSGATYAIEKPEDAIVEYRVLFRTMLHGFRHILQGLRKVDAPIPDGVLISRLFDGCVRLMALYDGETREANDVMDWMAGGLLEVNLHVFQEVWTQKIGFFFDSAEKRPVLMHLAQILFGREATSSTLVAIVLRFLIDRLPLLGEYDDQTAAVAIRMFKMAFGAVAAFPQQNESILASHLGKLIMDCFPLAAKASKPTNYFHLLRGLFRAIGGGGGRFELLYKEVLPLLPEMLECLNRQLLASDGVCRDMVVELCLTVPLRLTHLLPYLTYLMQPLALALRGGPELVSQGLRTLELCIDNLTSDFLDPTLNTVLRELMEALHNHLKPLPANHHHSHTTIRILGKLGGRNRRLLDKEPLLMYHHYSDPVKARIGLGGSDKPTAELRPVASLAVRTLQSGKPGTPYRVHAYDYIETSISLLLHEGVKGRDQEDVYTRCLEGLFDAIHLPEVQERAEKGLHELSRFVFISEIRRGMSKDVVTRKYPSPLLACYLEALPHGLAREDADESHKAQELMKGYIQELLEMSNDPEFSPQDIIPTLNQIASRFSTLCLEDSWVRKSAGCAGIKLMTDTGELGVKWINDREVDLVRTLLHVLKDMPYDLPRDVDGVLDVLIRVLRVSNGDLKTAGDDAHMNRNKVVLLVGIFFAELSSANATVRMAAQKCIELLAELSDREPSELLMPHRDRMLTAIYTKPLRALPFPIQIGMIEAVRYCVSLNPPLPELNDELLRLLHETLALADADDVALLGPGNARQGSLDIIKLRVTCIKLLTASMPLTDFFSKHPQTRQRVTGVYFKSLYSPTPEVKEVAHEGLRMVLLHQSRLPRELLQSGLRPILMNLADPKRLSIPGLEGLARLLELLTNYFKVEIGQKLLDHFRFVADPQMLQAASKLPLAENEGITKLVRLANIFHLLPSAANIFLDDLVNAIVETESKMHFSSTSPFSEPLARYLDRFPTDAVDFLKRNISYGGQLRTFRSILQAKLAPNLLRELISQASAIIRSCLESKEPSRVLSGLLLCSDLANLVPHWLTENQSVVDAVLVLWKSDATSLDRTAPLGDVTERYRLMLSILMKGLDETPRIDLLFDLILVFTLELPLDFIKISQFLYRLVALSDNLAYRRNILLRFCIWFDDLSQPWTHKTYFLQYVISPMVLVHAARSTRKEGLFDEQTIHWFNTRIWQPMADDSAFPGADDLFRIELLHLTTIMVHQYPDSLHGVKKVILKSTWHYVTNEDPVVKQTACLLAARFFEAFEGTQKFLLGLWTGLLRPPHLSEGKALVRQALDILAPVLLRSQSNETGYPQWAKNTRRLLAEEGSGWSQIGLIYQLIVRQSSLFYPVRALFIPHIVNYLNKLGLSSSSTAESRLLSVDIVQVIFDWEQKATASNQSEQTSSTDEHSSSTWVTPLVFRETMVSYLVRLATTPPEAQGRPVIVERALALLRTVVGPSGWSDVTVKLPFFLRALEQNDLNDDVTKSQALSAAKVLGAISADKSDSWYHANAIILTKLVRKGMVSDDPNLQDRLHPVFDRLIHLFPLPKEDEDQHAEVAEFHSFIHTAIGDHLRNAENLRTTSVPVLRGTLLMLKSVVQYLPERIESFSASLMKLLSKLAKDHIQSSPSATGFDVTVKLITSILEICQTAIAHLGDQRRWLLSTLVVLVDKSKSGGLCRYMLDVAREWAMNKRDQYPTMKEKASLLQKMVTFESRGERGEPIFNSYLELIYDIYTDPTLRRSDLTARLEQPFLLGCRALDPSTRERFVDLLDSSIPRSLINRLTYILGVQSWEALADHNWIFLALHLLLGSSDLDLKLVPDTSTTLPFSPGRVSSFIRPVQKLLFLDPQVAHDTWVSVFPAAWACLTRREQVDVNHHMNSLLIKDYHIKQAELRPNVIQTLLAGVHACSPPMTLPPHVVKYLAKTHGAWHIAAEMLQSSLNHVRDDERIVRDTVYDSLAEIYAELSEEDLFYGLWRRRSMFPETNTALSFEQCGMWEQASSVYEIAQTKTRSNILPFSEAEFCLWEDHWMLAAEKLQQWDTLYDLARAEGNNELMLESAWRIKDWTECKDTLEEQINQLSDIATPRRRVFEAFIALLKMPAALDKNTEFTRILEDAMQLSLRKWISLPPHLSAAHVPLLQHFQQFVELQEAVQIFGSLSTTNAQNLEKKSSDLKMVLQAWRERLPNIHDDISIWSDLVAWRQNVFNAINKAYIPLINNAAQGGNTATGSTNTFGYRGYHETAWIINRFAHVARKHELLDVCFNSLNKIYTLPNIEISEAFLKLREQARCHYQKPGDLQAGLEVINNTNLMYFSTSQKAEFYTLKGLFHAKFGRTDEAIQAFGSAVQLDMMQAKAWAAWGRFNDRRFTELPNEMSWAANAVSCYLQAAGLYKSGKSRPLLTRVLWLLSVDDNAFLISRAFDTYKGDAVFWYWITLIPQLCLSISHREVKQARYILLNLAKHYPQALFFHLRTTKEEMQIVKRQAVTIAAQRAASISQSAASSQDVTAENGADGVKADESGSHLQASPQNGARPADAQPRAAVDPRMMVGENHLPAQMRQAWEYIEEVVQILKTAFPLLILSLETMVDQISQRFKATPDEEIYRLVCMLLQDAISQYIVRMHADDDGQLPSHTITNLNRLAINLTGSARKDYEEDFLKSRPSLRHYIERLQKWRDKYERQLDARPRIQSLDLLSHYLTEFQYSKFDEIEVPGQYTEDKDSNQNFVRIQKFGPKFENCRSHGYCWRRFTVHGHDNSRTSFAVQLPSGRHCRREERVMQLFRTFNGTLLRKKESRKRNLQFHLPAAISCGPNLRLWQTDTSYITLGDVYDQHCEDRKITREEPILLVGEKVKAAMREFKETMGRTPTKPEYLTLKKDMMDEVVLKHAPTDILTRYMIRTMDGPCELWRMRKQFALQLAATSFMTYVLCLTSRLPSRFHLSRSTGQIAMSELLPGVSGQNPVFASNDAVPFRFTPNMDHFMGQVLTEGVFITSIMTIGRCLTEPEYELEQQLCLFARDEVMTWLHTKNKQWNFDQSFRSNVAANIDGVVKRAETLACKLEREEAVKNIQNLSTTPVVNTVTKLVNDATSPVNLIKMTEMFLPWF